MAEALMWNGALVACGTHGKKRTFKKPSWPRGKCPVCWCVALADQLETSIYEEDVERLLKFAARKATITYKETHDDV